MAYPPRHPRVSQLATWRRGTNMYRYSWPIFHLSGYLMWLYWKGCFWYRPLLFLQWVAWETVNLLLTKSVRPHLKAGVTSVHVVFDNPGLLPEAPKEMEHRRRDNTTKDLSAHHCIHFSSEQCIFQVHGGQYLLSMQESPDTLPNWRRAVHVVPSSLHGTQSFITNVGCTAVTVSSNTLVYPEPTLRSNADEANLRVWLHCANSQGQWELFFPPDTDVYHLGLTTAQLIPESEVLLQLSKSLVENAKFMNLNALLQALSRTMLWV